MVNLRYCDGKLNHGRLLNEARLKVPCYMCRAEANGLKDEDVYRVCERCRVTICPKCQTQPCETLLNLYVFEKKYKFKNNKICK